MIKLIFNVVSYRGYVSYPLCIKHMDTRTYLHEVFVTISGALLSLFRCFLQCPAAVQELLGDLGKFEDLIPHVGVHRGTPLLLGVR